jgi:hypothetical protein
MKIDDRLKDEIAHVFESVEYGDIIFKLSPEKKTLDYEIRTTHKLTLGKPIIVHLPRPQEQHLTSI